MTASSRFGYSMFTGAVLSGALVGYEATKRNSHMVAAAASAHTPEGHMLLAAFIGLALVTGVVTFIVATIFAAKHRAGQRSQQPPRRPVVRQRGYGGYR